ncbi:MAG: hypothetical protein U0519_03655 [Candidatus Gracilibacteria bacterium]
MTPRSNGQRPKRQQPAMVVLTEAVETAGQEGMGAPAVVEVADCKLMNVAENPRQYSVKSCARIPKGKGNFGPATYTIGSKTFTIKNVVPKTTGKFTFTWPKFSQFDPGVEKSQENEPDPSKKLVDTQYGGITAAKAPKWRILSAGP